jgi:D-alanyl-D-alanine carboxypeptidase/D-alanyl-D-alanine-endopeptidase (penicillin-binding protein 4)
VVTGVAECGELPCLAEFTSEDGALVADNEGRTLFAKNPTQDLIPASTLKLLTAVSAIHYLGIGFRFRTEFYLDRDENLKVKGYGDPLLLSEVWQDLAQSLSLQIQSFNDLILDPTYFASNIRIPGRRHSTNPYDAPVGALCANFNTIHFKRTETGAIVSAESQTPMTPFAKAKVLSLGLSQGRYTFTHDRQEAARYAGDLLIHFLAERGVVCKGEMALGRVAPEDTLIYTHRSPFTLDRCIAKMMEFSNNFMANQIFISLGAHCYGPPGTLHKGVQAVTRYGAEDLNLHALQVVEGSGISRDNRLSARDMVNILTALAPYRHLLKRDGNIYYKTGSLRGVRTRAGYIETGKFPLSFAVFLNGKLQDIDALVECLSRAARRAPQR